MNRNEKENWISDVNEFLTSSNSVVVASYSGLTVAELSDLRKKCRESQTSIKITKNRLTKLALSGTKFEDLKDMFKGTTLVAYSDDAISPSRVIFNFAKTNEKLQIIGGYMDGVLDIDGVKAVASLPTLDEARAKICAVLQTPGGNIARALKAYSEKTA